VTRLRHIIKNTVISIAGQVVSLIGTILLTFAYGHFLGAFAFGELYFATTFVFLIGIPVDAGFNNQIIRDVAQKPDNASRLFTNVLLIRLGIWLIMYIAILLISSLLGYSLEMRLLIAICGFDLLFNTIVKTFVSMQYAFERTIFPVIGNLLEKGLTTLLGIFLLRSGAGVQVMAVVIVIGSLVNGIWQAIWYLRIVGTSFVIDPKLIGEILRTNIPFLFSGLLIVGYTSIDTVLLSLMLNSTVVGLYGAAARLTDAMTFLPNVVIAVVMYPIFSKLANTSDSDLKLVLEKSMNFMIFCGMPITILLIVAAPNIIGFLYGGGFTGAVPTLQASAPYVIFLYINFAFVTVVLSKKQDRVILITTGVALAFNLGLNLILIPLFQQIGSALVTSLTELLLCCIAVFVIPRHLLPFGSLKVALKALIASLLMAMAILSLHTLHLFVILPIAMLVYLGTAFLLGVIPREDYLAVYNALLRKTQRSTSLGTDELSEITVLAYDLPTMPLPAFYDDISYGGTKGTLLDIQMAITDQLPKIRLPLAPHRIGVLTKDLSGSLSNRLPETSFPSYSLPLKSGHAYCDEPFDITQPVTAALPAIRPQSEQHHPLKSIQLLRIRPHSPTQQEQQVSSLQGYTGYYGDTVL
jgi:O-antigen/teichoic acid export membrane protein